MAMGGLSLIFIMKKLFVVIIILMTKYKSMSQSFEVKYNGVNNIVLGGKINLHSEYSIQSSKKSIDGKKLRFGLPENHNYYSINSDDITINNIGKAEAVFFATDKLDNIQSIIIFIKTELLCDQFEDVLNMIYESKALRAISGVESSKETILMNWMKNRYNFFLRKKYNSSFIKIMMTKYSGEDNFADVILD